MIYLDHNATTPVAPEVREAMLPYLTDEWGNPSSTYRFGSKLKAVIETARDHVAALLHASPREILFTSCATESNNAALHAALKANPAKRHIVTSAVEHSSVLSHCQALESQLRHPPVLREHKALGCGTPSHRSRSPQCCGTPSAFRSEGTRAKHLASLVAQRRAAQAAAVLTTEL
jgi:selenocysteine lyase/cysteine desulfurase